MQRKKKKQQFDLYGYSDLIFKNLERRYIGLFNKLKNVPSDEKEVIRLVNEIYREVDEITRKYLLILAIKVYRKILEELEIEDIVDTITEYWIAKILTDYDKVTKYIYVHEVDRKRARTIESIIASDNKAKEVDTAKKQFSRQAKQYADNIVMKAVEQAFKDSNIKEVVWETEEDLKVCAICEDLEGKIFRLPDVPSKPHYGCRCWLTPLELWNE